MVVYEVVVTSNIAVVVIICWYIIIEGLIDWTIGINWYSSMNETFALRGHKGFATCGGIIVINIIICLSNLLSYSYFEMN